MKWILWVLAIALVLIGLDFLLGDNQEKQSISNDPMALSMYEDGMQDLFAFRFRSSIEKLERALDLDPSFAEAGIALTAAYYRLGKSTEAEASLALADSLTELIQDPKRRMLAQIRINRNSETTSYAIRDSLMERLTKEDPDNIFVLEALAGESDSMNNDDETEKIWRRILEIDPNYAASYNMLGYLELGRGNYEQAIEHMQKYAFLSPGMANPHDSLGDVYSVLGRYEEAEAEYREALKIQPEFFHSLINLGRIYMARGQIELGRSILDKVRAEVSGTKYEAVIDQELLNTYLAADLFDGVVETCARYIGKYPESDQTPFYRALQLVYTDQKGASRALMDSLLTDKRTAPEYKTSSHERLRTESTSLIYEAVVADLLYSPAARVKSWRRAVDFIADKIPLQDQRYLRRMLAQALLDAGRPNEALGLLEEMLKVNPSLSYSLALAVECSLVLENPEAARQFVDYLKLSLARADEDLPIVKRAPELEALVVELEGSS